MSACCNQVNMETLTLRTTYIGGRHSAIVNASNWWTNITDANNQELTLPDV